MRNHTPRFCKECDEEIEVKSWGDESLDWCEGCQQLEPDTYEKDEDNEQENSKFYGADTPQTDREISIEAWKLKR